MYVQYQQASWSCMELPYLLKELKRQWSGCPFVKTISLMNQWILFFTTLIFWIFELSTPLYWASKIFPIGTVLYFWFSKYFYCLLLQKFFKRFTGWNTRFNINIICIIWFTCNFCIKFLRFVGVSTFSVSLLLYISITQLFKKIIDYIQGFLLFFIRSVQLHYLLNKTFSMSLQSMTIWNIRSPNILRVFIVRNKYVVLHVWPNDILSHYITISQYYHLTISPFCIHFIISPLHHYNIESILLFSKLTMTPCSLFCVSLLDLTTPLFQSIWTNIKKSAA